MLSPIVNVPLVVIAPTPNDVSVPTLVIAVCAAAVTVKAVPLASPVTLPVNGPANAVAVNVPVPALYVIPPSVFGARVFPVADSNNATLHVVSVVSATMIFAMLIAADPSKVVPPMALPVANAVAVADNPVQLPELPLASPVKSPVTSPVTSPVKSPVKSPANNVDVNRPVFELNVKFVPVFGA